MAEQKKEKEWEDWQKKRIFVREVAGKYEEVFKQLLEQPRVYKSKQKPWKDGPTHFNKHIISPKDTSIMQTIHAHVVAMAPGSHGQKHGHMNSAMMYVLEGRGHEVHDGERYEWQAGDAILVKNACVHQHFNDDNTRPARVVVFKPKPLISFLNLYFQKTVSFPKSEPLAGFEDFVPSD